MKKSNLLLFTFLILNSCQCETEILHEVLNNPCYTDEKGNVFEVTKFSSLYNDINIGACSTGLSNRDEEGKLVCIGEIKPSQEQCNGIDDNCNSYIDDDYDGLPLTYSYFDIRNTCITTGVCRYSEQECVGGEWTCNYPSNYGQEKCDGQDNDCDGETDEDTDEEPIFDSSERYVYTSDPDTINVGECRAGYKECVNGSVYIRNMRTPVAEICGNDDDDDCDGLTDEVEGDEISNDFLFIIDYSGSMTYTINSVADAACGWSSQGILRNSRFAVIAIGYYRGNSKEIKVLTDFTDSDTACQIIRENNVSQNFGGLEFQLDATFDANEPSSSYGYVNWISDSRKIIIFSDEMLQQNFTRSIPDAIEAVVEQCQEQEYMIGAFISYNIQDQALWVDLTQRCDGFLDYLSNIPQQMIDKLNYWIGTDC